MKGIIFVIGQFRNYSQRKHAAALHYPNNIKHLCVIVSGTDSCGELQSRTQIRYG